MLFFAIAWLTAGAVAAYDMHRRAGRGWWYALCVLFGGFAGAAYWGAGRARSEVEARDRATATSDAPNVYACLAVTGRFDPDALTSILGVAPSVTGRAGDPEPYRAGKTREQDLWHFKTVEAAEFDWARHLAEVLSIVRPHADQFREFCSSRGAEVAVHLVAYVNGGAPIGAFPAEMVSELGALGCALDIDLHV